MTIDQVTGYIWIVFYDRRNYFDNQTDVFLAVSMDGGQSFSNFKVSESPFIPYQSIFFGDYTCIAAHNGVVRPIWTRLDGSDLTVYTAIIDTVMTRRQETDAIPFAIEENRPNPFSESTVFSFKLRSPVRVTLTVEDLFGHVVTTLINQEYLERGKHMKVFDPSALNLSSGVYYFRLKGHGISRQQKIVYLKN